MQEQANNIIKNHMYMAVGAGLIPVPFVDFVAVTGIQLDMLKKLADLYGADFQKNQAKVVISALGGAGIARMAAGMTKVIPVIGTILGGVTMSILSGASTYAVGEVFKNHFAEGGSFADLNVEKFKEFYKEKFEQGKGLAKDMEAEQKAKEAGGQASDAESFDDAIFETVPDTGDKIQQLKDLAKLKKDSVITDKEFKKMKKELLG